MDSPRTVLLIEKEPQVRDVIKEILERAGFCVFHARNGVEGLRLFERRGSAFDLLMTGRPEPEFEALVRRQPGLRLLVLSTAGDLDPTPGVPILAKPFTPEALLRAVRDVLSRPAETSGTDANPES